MAFIPRTGVRDLLHDFTVDGLDSASMGSTCPVTPVPAVLQCSSGSLPWASAEQRPLRLGRRTSFGVPAVGPQRLRNEWPRPHGKRKEVRGLGPSAALWQPTQKSGQLYP